MSWDRSLSALTFVCGSFLVVGEAHALRIPQGGFTVEPVEVYRGRTVTVSLLLEDDLGSGSAALDVQLKPQPASAVKLINTRMSPDFTCSGRGKIVSQWVYEALTTGTVTFSLRVSQLACNLDDIHTVEGMTGPVRVKDVSIWSELNVTPHVAAPGGDLFLTLLLRNEEPFTTTVAYPQAEIQYRSGSQVQSDPKFPLYVEPIEVARGGRLGLYLPPRQTVSLNWRFVALRPGEARFVVKGHGKTWTSQPVQIRDSARPVLHMPDPVQSAVAGDLYTLWGTLCNEGAAQLASPSVNLSWHPKASARLRSVELASMDVIAGGGGATDLAFVLELVDSGELSLTVTAEGIEADSGRPVSAEPWSYALTVLPR